MKKILAVICAGALLLALLAGCGAKESSTGSDSEYIKDKGTLVIGITVFEPMD